jgi:hypothetical protein
VTSKYGIKNHTQRLAYLSRELSKRLSMNETLFQWRTLYTILTNKAAKGKKKGTIVAMIVGANSYYVKLYNMFGITYLTWQNMGLIAKRCF